MKYCGADTAVLADSAAIAALLAAHIYAAAINNWKNAVIERCTRTLKVVTAWKTAVPGCPQQKQL
jgi:hypothetical protein